MTAHKAAPYKHPAPARPAVVRRRVARKPMGIPATAPNRAWFKAVRGQLVAGRVDRPIDRRSRSVIFLGGNRPSQPARSATAMNADMAPVANVPEAAADPTRRRILSFTQVAWAFNPIDVRAIGSLHEACRVMKSAIRAW